MIDDVSVNVHVESQLYGLMVWKKVKEDRKSVEEKYIVQEEYRTYTPNHCRSSSIRYRVE